jgi:hypothetical protein
MDLDNKLEEAAEWIVTHANDAPKPMGIKWALAAASENDPELEWELDCNPEHNGPMRFG